jgi:hypothetical protein
MYVSFRFTCQDTNGPVGVGVRVRHGERERERERARMRGKHLPISAILQLLRRYFFDEDEVA